MNGTKVRAQDIEPGMVISSPTFIGRMFVDTVQHLPAVLYVRGLEVDNGHVYQQTWCLRRNELVTRIDTDI